MNNKLYSVYPLTLITEGKQDKYRNILKKKFCQRWKNFWPKLSEDVRIVTQRYETLIPGICIT